MSWSVVDITFIWNAVGSFNPYLAHERLTGLVVDQLGTNDIISMQNLNWFDCLEGSPQRPPARSQLENIAADVIIGTDLVNPHLHTTQATIAHDAVFHRFTTSPSSQLSLPLFLLRSKYRHPTERI